MKERINITIDEDIIKKAREQQLNVSEVTEKAIKDKLLIKDVQINLNEKCYICGFEGPKETAENVNENERAMTWLWPDEKWICNSCLKRKMAHVPVGHR